jgi:ketopantoate hydroxymethyltransferase
MLGMDGGFKPKFLRHYAAGEKTIAAAVNAYHADVVSGAFPGSSEMYA